MEDLDIQYVEHMVFLEKDSVEGADRLTEEEV